MLLEALLLIGLLALLLYKSVQKPANMPPGTFGLPVVGNLPPTDRPVTEHLATLKKKYGNIFTTKWGSRVIVVLADYHLIRKALSHPDLQGRVSVFSFDVFYSFMNIGVINSTGKVWADTRRFLLRNLRDLGMGKTYLENSIQDEAKMLVEYLEEHNLDKPSQIDFSINVSVLNVIWQMLASKRYRADDEYILQYNRLVEENFSILRGPIFLVDMMPWLLKIIPSFVINKYFKAEVIAKNRDIFNALFYKTITEHKMSLDPENPRDVLDHYLLEIEATKHDPDTTFKADYKNLMSTMADMFVAGSETTASTLRWMILYMAIKPEIQSKAQKALDEVVPRDRLPSLNDRSELPYIDALILDVMRLSSLIPLSVPHSPTADIQFEGYTIPKGTMVLPCLQMCHRDPAAWKCPDELYPEHFLDEDGKLDSKKDSFMPFSVGRRQCLGESLARMELFLFASAILQRFTIQPPPGVTLSTSTDPADKRLNMPMPFKVVLKKRI